jgi:hypothetical protein
MQDYPVEHESGAILLLVTTITLAVNKQLRTLAATCSSAAVRAWLAPRYEQMWKFCKGCGRRGSQLPRRAFSVVWGVLGLHLGKVVSADRRIGCFRVRYRAISGRC